MSALDFLKIILLLGILGAWAFNRWLKDANEALRRQTASSVPNVFDLTGSGRCAVVEVAEACTRLGSLPGSGWPRPSTDQRLPIGNSSQDCSSSGIHPIGQGAN